jgi:hypothetical protein
MRRQDWDSFVKSMENCISGTKWILFKILMKLKMEENDRLEVNLIPKETWKVHYISLLNTQNIQ